MTIEFEQYYKMQQNQKSLLLWTKLKKLLISKEIYEPIKGPSMNLFERELLKSDINQTGIILSPNITYKVHNQNNSPSQIKDIIEINNKEIDNTGSLYWQAEEILAYYIINNIKLFDKVKTVIELGSGKSGLAAISFISLISSGSIIKDIIITDGNQSSVLQLNSNIILNAATFKELDIKLELGTDFEVANSFRSSEQLCLKTGVLQWRKVFNQTNIYQGMIAILVSDCLFFEKFHLELISTILFLLKNGTDYKQNFCLIACPSRGGSLQRFIEIAIANDMLVELIDYDNIIYKQEMVKMQSQAQYDQDRHQIQIIKLKAL